MGEQRACERRFVGPVYAQRNQLRAERNDIFDARIDKTDRILVCNDIEKTRQGEDAAEH